MSIINTSQAKPRISHSPMKGEHYSIHYEITSAGRVIITKPVTGSNDEVDEIDLPAALILKLAGLLKLTRKIG
jgi:hypothetical protein